MGEPSDTHYAVNDSADMRPAKKSRIGERTMLACVPCKQRKLKCDGGSPECENCLKNSRECLVEDPATGLHRPRDYLQLLETRVKYLEDLIHRLHPNERLDGDSLSVNRVGHDSTVEPFISALSCNQPHETSSEPSGSPTVDHLSTEVALLCLSAAGHEPRYFGPSSAVSFSHIVSQTMGLRKTSRATHAQKLPDSVSATSRSTYTQSSSWPSTQQAEQLTGAYLGSVHPQFPFLHQPTFKHWELACRRSGSSSSKPNDVATFFAFMVYAIGSLVARETNTSAAEEYYGTAMEHLEPILEMDSLESVQALIAIAVYSVRSPSGVSLWKVSGMAMRLCIQLGFHRSVEKYRPSGSALSREMSKRCFWVAYDFDRYVSCILGLPGAISDLSIDVELPLDINDGEVTPAGIVMTADRTNSTTMTGAIHTIRLRQIWSKFSTHLFPTSSLCSHDVHLSSGLSIEELRQELEDWRASAPVVGNAAEDSPLSVFASHGWFQLAYCHSILLLYRHYIMDTKPYKCSPPLPRTPQIVDRAFQECYTKARDMCLLYRRLYQSPSIHFTWGSLHMLFFGGLTYLYCLWRSKPIRDAAKQRDVVNTCMACQTVLVIIAERWKLATSYRDLFEALSERTISMMCGDIDLNPAVSNRRYAEAELPFQEPVFSLQDWANGFDTLDMPPESEWLVSELFHGDEGVHPNDLYGFDNIDAHFGSQAEAFQFPTMWNNAGVL